MAEPNGSPVTVGQLMAVLGQVRRHALLIWGTTLILGTLGLATLLLVLALWLDHVLVLPAMLRTVLLLIVVAGPAWFFYWAWHRHPGRSAEETALLIERRYPSLDNALINSIQLTREMPEGSEDIIAAITVDAQQAVRSIRPAAAVSKRELSSAGAVAAVAVLLLTAHALASTDGLGPALHRVLAPFADNTLTRIVKVTPGGTDVLKGEPIEIAVHVAGRVPTRAELVGTYPDGREVQLSLAAPSPDNPQRLTTRIEQVEQNLRYSISAGDDRSDRYELRVHEPPTIDQITQHITPPDYVHAEPTQTKGGTVRALAGAEVTLRFEASAPFEAGTVALDDGRELPLTVQDSAASDTSTVGSTTLKVEQSGQYAVTLTHPLGFKSEPMRHDIVVEPDQTPQVSFTEPAEDMHVPIDAHVQVRIEANDDHAVRRIELVQIAPESQNLPEAERPDPKSLTTWSLDTQNMPSRTQHTTREHIIRVAELGLDGQNPVILQAVAYDFNPRGAPGRSALRTLHLEEPPTAEEILEGEQAYEHVSLEQLIDLQRTNVASSQSYKAALEHAASDAQAAQAHEEDLPMLIARQEQILTDAVQLANATTGAAASNPFIQRRLGNLAETLMTVAVSQLERVRHTSDPARMMGEAVETQEQVLKQLIVAEARQDSELADRRHREIVEVLAELIAKQEALHADTNDGAATSAALAARQRTLSHEAGVVQRLLEREATRGSIGNEEQAQQYTVAAAAFNEHAVRASMIVIVERLTNDAPASAVSLQQQVLADLRAIERLLRDMAMEDAQEKMEDVAENLRDAKEKLDKMVNVQEAVTEVAKDLHKRADKRDGSIEGFGENVKDLVDVRKNLAEAIEQLAKDLHLHPDTPVSNDLLAELSEVFEQVDQQEGSEELPVSEIAVTRDENVLANLKRMQEEMAERLPDAEMWLPDTPENLRWQRETFDRDELGAIPLGDLPEALEDIVGEMLEYNEELRDESRDTASNMHFPDHTFGQEVKGGDLTSWAAKGKSGNEPPEENEQTGRSGSGRQGMSSGEIVGDTVKSLEGSDVHTRRTQDPFQAGELKEENPGGMDVKATGGGKMAGVSPGEGMQGEAPPRNELHLRKLARRHQQLKRNVETLYSTAKLLRLPTGELDSALLQMHAAERQLEAGDLLGYLHNQEQVVRAFARTHARLQGRQVVESNASESDLGAAVVGATQEPVPEQYEDAVAEYMRRIAEQR